MTTLQLLCAGAFLFVCGFVWGQRYGWRHGHYAGWLYAHEQHAAQDAATPTNNNASG
jgi:hypothetical protein